VPESSSSTDPGYVVARLGRPHGLDGYLGLYVEEPDTVYFQPDESVIVEGHTYTVGHLRPTDRGYQVLFKGVSTREAAEELRGRDISVPARRDLTEDEFWPEELVGLEVREHGGDVVGKVIELIPGAAQDRLAVEVRSARYEIPFVAALVPVVDLEAGFIEISPVPGLIEPLA
jgi:16S rRNA processing protein RimM